MRVLSIDFDIIMAPCINLYNDMNITEYDKQNRVNVSVR